MAIAEDASTPAVVDSGNNTTGTVTSASFSPPANSLIVVVVNAAFQSVNTPAVTVADSAANSFTNQVSELSAAENTYVFSRFYSSAPGSITVTSTDTNHAQCLRQLAVRVLTGAASTQTGAATAVTQASSATMTGSITTTVTGSWVYLGVSCNNNVSLSAVNAGTTSIDTIGSGTEIEAAGTARQASATGTPGATTLGFTASGSTHYSWAALEVLAATGSGTNAPAGLPASTGAVTAGGPSVSIGMTIRGS